MEIISIFGLLVSIVRLFSKIVFGGLFIAFFLMLFIGSLQDMREVLKDEEAEE